MHFLLDEVNDQKAWYIDNGNIADTNELLQFIYQDIIDLKSFY